MTDFNKRESAFWDRVLQLKYAALYAANWWNESELEQRWWVIPTDTMQWLHGPLRDMPLGPDFTAEGMSRSFVHVNDCIDCVRLAYRRLKNTAHFGNMRLPDNHFLWTRKHTGEVITEPYRSTIRRKRESSTIAGSRLV